MANLSDKINAARKEGYSDDEIINHLSSTDLRSKIEAAKKEGYSSTEIADHLGGSSQPSQDAPVSGLYDQFMAGAESNSELPGQTIETFGKTAGSQGLQDAGKYVRDLFSQPDNFVSATDRFINPKQGDSYVDPVMGFGWGNLPGAAAEVGGQMTGDIAVRAGFGLAGAGAGSIIPGVGTTAGGAAGALAGPAMLEFMRVAGPVALERAKNNGRDVPDWSDWEAAAATAGVSGILNAIGIKGIGALNQGVQEVGKKTITQVAKEAVTETAKKAGKEGLTEFGQSITEQTGSTLGTDKGLNIDLKQAVGEGILGAGAGGMIDAGRNARPTFNTAVDVYSIDSAMRNDPDAQVKAEITQKVNNIADRMKGSGKAPVSKEINDSVANLRNQIKETLKNQNLSPEDKRAIEDGLKTANGLDKEDVDAIAGRSENPSEIKALIRKIQVVREMTMQQQSAKGLRGAIADTAYNMGSPLGAFIGDAMFPGGGAAAGAFIGDRIGTGISRRLKGNQTQGVAIDSLVGKKQARRAQMLLDRYGPSEATTALNTLTEKAAANKAQAEAEAQAKKDWQDTLNRIKMANQMRKNVREQWENAPDGQAKEKAKAAKQEADLKTREQRLASLAIQAQQRQVRLQTMAAKLEAEKSLNALRVEKAQAERDLANAKAQNAKSQADGKVLDLTGKLLKIVDDIKLREQAIKKAEISTKRAEQMAARVPGVADAAKAAAKRSAQRYAKMTSDQVGNVKLDQFGNPIADAASYQMGAEYIMRMESEGLSAASAFPDKELGNKFIKTINLLHAFKGPKNQERRMAIYNDLLSEVDQRDLDAQRFIVTYIVPLAFAFEGKAGQGASQGFGEDPPF